MKLYLIVLCAVFLNANCHIFDYHSSDKYEAILEDDAPNYKEGYDKFMYIDKDYINSNELDPDVKLGTTEETKTGTQSYEAKEDHYFIKSCPEYATSNCQCGCSPTCPCACKQVLEDYYWRDYKDIIPEDALPVDRNIYIGQVYIENKGLYVGPIIPGVREIEVSAYGVRRQDYLIKILCTQHKDNFCWLNTTSTTFHEDVEDKSPVVGGYDTMYNHGELNIGRVVEDERLNLGGISSFEPEEVYLWYPKRNEDFKALNYQILMYDEMI